MERTNLIIISTVFAVALVSFVLMVSNTTSTGMFNVYGEENKLNPRYEARMQEMLAERHLSGGQEPYGVPLGWQNPATGQAYTTQEGQDPVNLGQVLTTAWGVKKDKDKRFVAKRNGCFVFGLPELQDQLGLQRTGKPESMNLYTCYKQGDITEDGKRVTIRTATNDPLIWGPEYTWCCF